MPSLGEISAVAEVVRNAGLAVTMCGEIGKATRGLDDDRVMRTCRWWAYIGTLLFAVGVGGNGAVDSALGDRAMAGVDALFCAMNLRAAWSMGRELHDDDDDDDNDNGGGGDDDGTAGPWWRGPRRQRVRS